MLPGIGAELADSMDAIRIAPEATMKIRQSFYPGVRQSNARKQPVLTGHTSPGSEVAGKKHKSLIH